MHDHDRHVEQFGMTDGAMRGLALDHLRPRERVIIRRNIVRRSSRLGHELDRVIAFAMDHHQRLLAARAFEHLQQLPVVQHHVVIGHEDLERGVAVPTSAGSSCPSTDGRRIGDDQMKGRSRYSIRRPPACGSPRRRRAATCRVICSAKGRTVVLPPAMRRRVPDAKSSAITISGPEGGAQDARGCRCRPAAPAGRWRRSRARPSPAAPTRPRSCRLARRCRP